MVPALPREIHHPKGSRVMRTTRTVPHPRWPGRKVAPAERRDRARARRVTEDLGLCTARLHVELERVRLGFEALRDEQRRANNIAVMEGADPTYARREAFVRQVVAARAGSAG
jgi:hypothetical protein